MLAGWRSLLIGRYVLRVDTSWPHARAAVGDVEVVMLGHAIDVAAPLADPEQVVRELAEARARSREAFLDHLDRLCGAHVIVVRNGDRYTVVQDATGMETAAYDSAGAPMVSSQRGSSPSSEGTRRASSPGGGSPTPASSAAGSTFRESAHSSIRCGC